jgi:MscS family membrane protein
MKEWINIIETLLSHYLENQSITEDIRVSFDTFNSFSLDIKVTYFSLEKSLAEFTEQKQEINLQIKELFEKQWIEMAFPTQEMIIKNETIPLPAKKKSK